MEELYSEYRANLLAQVCARHSFEQLGFIPESYEIIKPYRSHPLQPLLKGGFSIAVKTIEQGLRVNVLDWDGSKVSIYTEYIDNRGSKHTIISVVVEWGDLPNRIYEIIRLSKI